MEIKLIDIETKAAYLVGYQMPNEKYFFHQIIYTDEKLLKWKLNILKLFPQAYYFVQKIDLPTFLNNDFTPF